MSKILVDEIAPKTTGGVITTSGMSNIIESFTHICDGSSITLLNCTVTLPNITAAQQPGNTYADLSSSVISYTPPAGTSYVHYKHYFNARWNTTHGITHQKLYIGGAEVVYARTTFAGQYAEGKNSMEWVFPIGGTADANTGRQSSWASSKQIKMQVRDYGSTNDMDYHITQYWDGTGTGTFSMPLLSITAYR